MTETTATTASSTGSDTATGTGQVAIGSSGLSTYPLCLGGNVFGWSADEAASFEVLDAFVEAGGDLVDTADVYSAWVDGHSGGESEAVIGRWAARRSSPHGLQVATKTGMLEGADLSPAKVSAALDASLQRLQRDQVDLYYAHRDEEERAVEEVAEAFGAVVSDGRARAWAVSNWSAARVDAVVAAAERAGLPGPVAVQEHGSAVSPPEADKAAAAQRHGLLQLPYSTLASGFLTGKYTRDGEAPESVRASGVQSRFADERGFRVLDAVTAVARDRGVEVATVALAWLRAQGAVPIASARTVRQLQPLLAVVTVELSADEVESITAAGR